MARNRTLPEIRKKGYARGDRLVTTEWLAKNLENPALRILESDEDVLLYDMGHIPGAQKIDWHADLNDHVLRDYIPAGRFQELLVHHWLPPAPHPIGVAVIGDARRRADAGAREYQQRLVDHQVLKVLELFADGAVEHGQRSGCGVSQHDAG